MTDIGYNDLIDRIVNREVIPPERMTLAELNSWLNGYAKCQNDIIDIINECRKGQKE